MTAEEQVFEDARNLLSVNCPMAFHLLIRIFVSADERVDTAAIGVFGSRINLMYNTHFFASLTRPEQMFVLTHEMMHLLLHHCTHRSSHDRSRAYKENVAMDLAINTLIEEDNFTRFPRVKEDKENIKKGEVSVLLPEQFGFPPKLSFNQYLDLLDQKYPDKTIKFVIKQKGASSVSADEFENADVSADIEVEIDIDSALGKITCNRISAKHGEHYNEDPFVDDFIRNQVEEIFRNKLWGNASGSMIEAVKKAQEQPLNWADILHLRLGQFISFDKEQSRRRWNKHYGKPFLGYTTKSVEPVAVYVDTSGSVGTTDLSRFIVEIERIAHYTTVFMWCFDVKVIDPDECITFSRRNIDQIEFKGRGGTSFWQIFEHAKEKQIRKIVILTDGYAENISQAQVEGLEVIWTITPGGETKGKPGTVVEMQK